MKFDDERFQIMQVGRRVCMSEADHDVALEDTDRVQGRTALVRNVAAAVALSGAVRSTLGPRGMDKMLVDDSGEVLVTNDGVTVLETAKVEHPTANLLIAASSAQDRDARDGTTTTVILMAEMLQNALELVRTGVHPTIIVNGFQIANEEALTELDRLARAPKNDAEHRAVVSTSLAGKIDTKLVQHLTDLALEAAATLIGEDGGEDLERLRIKRLQISDGVALESELIPGLFIAKTRTDISSDAESEGGKIAIIDGALEVAKLEFDAHIEVHSAGVLRGFHERDEENLRTMVDQLSELDIELLVVRDGIADEVIPMLTAAGITAYRRFEREDLERLARMTGARMVRDTKRMTMGDVGIYTKRSERVIGGVKYTRIEADKGGAMTVLLKGTSPELREEVSRAFSDALGVAHRLNLNPNILPGGGATQTHLARHLRSFATTQSGREQMAIEAFAAALEIVPRTLAQNAGRDPIDEILALSAAQANDQDNGAWIGIDGIEGVVTRMDKMGIIDPLFVVSHAISGATTAAISVLRIDDVLWAKQGPQTPDWSDQIEDN
ncbi:MAG: hypothetical protein CXT72_03700 [Methanobacteriota archaeon]|nr:MAG: hypothetical protein CXT72_03700 [Euryarchaeota archaeon]HIE63406.1 hypothetical protein [Candidatus Poseidoniales archaeon]HIL00369.1 hypothetical protein [Candidatus Poseidoniales archaeon]